MRKPENFKIVKETLLDGTVQYRVMEFVTKRKFPNFWETEKVWVYSDGYYDGYSESYTSIFNSPVEAQQFIDGECRDYFKQIVNREEI